MTPPLPHRVAAEVVLGQDLHARPAAAVAAWAGRHPGAVQLHVGTAQSINAASVLALMAADLRRGTTVRVSATGPNADGVIRRIIAELSATA